MTWRVIQGDALDVLRTLPADCGAPRRRVVGEARAAGGRASGNRERVPDYEAGRPRGWSGPDRGTGVPWTPTVQPTVGWEPTCGHPQGRTAPCLVLDPFAGSGTTGMVARRHGRSFVGVELSPIYAAMARERIESDAPLLNGRPGGAGAVDAGEAA